MYILKEKMDTNDAKKIFGIIDNIPSESELKDIHKKLVMKHHPDRGGDLTTMQDVNAAYDLLKPLAGNFQRKSGLGMYPDAKSKDFWDNIQQKRNKAYVAMHEYFEKTFDLEKLKSYLEGIFGEELTVEKYNNDPSNDGWKVKFHTDEKKPSDYEATVSFFNSDKSVYFRLIYLIFPKDIATSGLGYDKMEIDDLLFEVDISTSLYYNKRNAKLTQRNYTSKIGSKKLADFSELFPKDMILKTLEKSSVKKFRKADMLLGLARELNATIDGDKIFLYPFGKDIKFYINMSRYTMMKIPSYSFSGIQAIHPSNNKYKYYRFHANVFTIYETEENLDKIVSAVKGVVLEVEKKNMDIVENYDAVCGAFDKAIALAFPKD